MVSWIIRKWMRPSTWIRTANPDRDQEDIKCVATETGGFKIGISIRDAENADSIAVHPIRNP